MADSFPGAASAWEDKIFPGVTSVSSWDMFQLFWTVHVWLKIILFAKNLCLSCGDIVIDHNPTVGLWAPLFFFLHYALCTDLPVVPTEQKTFHCILKLF